MPDAKNNAKATGDTHPPEIEDDDGATAAGRPEAEASDDTAPDASLSRDVANESRAGKGINQAGYLKDKNGGVDRDKS